MSITRRTKALFPRYCLTVLQIITTDQLGVVQHHPIASSPWDSCENQPTQLALRPISCSASPALQCYPTTLFHPVLILTEGRNLGTNPHQLFPTVNQEWSNMSYLWTTLKPLMNFTEWTHQMSNMSFKISTTDLKICAKMGQVTGQKYVLTKNDCSPKGSRQRNKAA